MVVEPLDDDGADAADRFDWQAAMATADCLALYLAAIDHDGRLAENEDRRIVCERHEDWVVIHGDDAEIVSGKHREPAYGAYTTLNKLFDDGGIAHLFLRWLALNETPTCRLVTTAGLHNGLPQQLEAACKLLCKQRLQGDTIGLSSDFDDLLTKACKALKAYLDALAKKERAETPPSHWLAGGFHGTFPLPEHAAQLTRFLSMLNIDHGRPMRSYLGHAAPGMYARPVLERLGWGGPPEAIWEAVLALFRVRMRAAGPLPAGALPKVMAYRPGVNVPGPADIERSLASRIVTMADVDVAIRLAIANPGGYQPLPRLARTSRLAVKLAAGGCADNTIERAEQLRSDYQDYWRARISVDPAAQVEQGRVRRQLLRHTDEATRGAQPFPAESGPALWGRIQRRIDEVQAGELPTGMDPDLMLGGVCDLANRCQVWFSNAFDVDTEIVKLRQREEGS